MKALRISDTEWEVMRAVWGRYPATASEIITRLANADPSWHPKTVRTLLARLVQKKVLSYEAKGRTYVYSPLVTEEECVSSASASFLDRVFGGALKPMLAHFVGKRQLSSAELAELRRLLDEAGGKPSNKPGRKK